MLASIQPWACQRLMTDGRSSTDLRPQSQEHPPLDVEGCHMVDVNVRPDIDAAAAKLQSALGSKREIQRLPEVLWGGELVEMLATGVSWAR
ncbi:hypothetical protein [Streptomyces sp. KL118A]|uniref:hypothetical protein n=1 Tax=Streptomyces sp. KL118A TaxID=3045153 RepID=UPI00278BC00F|nr:hypothetical protein [Streptomyces sp. KL118A]